MYCYDNKTKKFVNINRLDGSDPHNAKILEMYAAIKRTMQEAYEKFGIEYVEDDSDEDSVSILMCDEDYNNMTPEEQNAYPLICLLQKMYDTDNAEVENEEEKN